MTPERPMRDMLMQVSRRVSLHMPGGQGRAPFAHFDPYRLETTELDVTDDLYKPSGAIARAEALAAKSAQAAYTLLLHGGSTAGLHAMLLYAARRGEEVILPRNAHLSVLNLCATAGLRPVFAQPSFTPSGRPYTTLEAYIRAMDAHPRARAALAVRPDYYGAMPPLYAIAEAAHKRGLLMLCDEAHGAYFNWDEKAKNAGRIGADLFVQSAHKTLPALNGGAWLHAGAGIDAERLRRMLAMVQTSSPSFVGMLALDDARAWMDANGARACARLRKALDSFRETATGLGYPNAQDEPGMDYDPLRLVLYAPQGGFTLAKALTERGLDVELSDERRIACILSLMDGEKRLRLLLNALRRIPPKSQMSSAPLPPAGLPEAVLSLSEAVFAESEPVALNEAEGRIAARAVGLYPPGTALLIPGERIERRHIAFIETLDSARVNGLSADGALLCVRES